MDFVALVQQQLRPDDTCKFAVEAKEITGDVNNGIKKLPKCLALVCYHAVVEEYILLEFKRRLNTWSLEDVFPVFEDMRIRVLPNQESAFEIGYSSTRPQVYVFEAPSQAVLDSVLLELQKVQKSAQKNNQTSTGTSHQWIKYYIQRVSTPDSNLNESNEIEKDKSSYSPRSLVSRGASSEAVAAALASQGNPNVLNTLLKGRHASEYDPAKFRALDDSWVNTQLKAREAEFTKMKNLTMFLGTWNVNGKKPGESLEPWLRDPSLQPDIYAIGFQELDLTAEALFLGDTTRAAPWEQQIMATLQLQGEYARVLSKQLVGILLCVYVKKEHYPFVKDVQSGLAAVGIMGMMGNKGGVAVRFQIYDSTICVVNSHLNAHFENVQRRNQDMRDIARRVMFGTEESGNVYTIYDHDMLFWIGDLNYRLIGSESDVKEKIARKDWATLFQADQLYLQMKAGNAFDGFQEYAINFAPSYKYDIGTNIYDTSEKRRTPAWCDRVLYRSSKAAQDNLVPLGYKRHELLTSDHRPVSASFQLKVRLIVPEQRSKVYQELVKELDKKENESMPDAHISANSVVFQNVRYMVALTQSIVIENTSQVVAKYRFIPKLDERRFCKEWLWVSPTVGIMAEGERITINLTVQIDNNSAPAFNMGKESLEDILILHLENGKDYFITVQGNYLVSSFGCSLDYLIRFPHPVRNSTPLGTNETKLSIPKELWRIVDFIYKKGLTEEGLFLQSGVQREMEIIRECLDTGEGFEKHSLSVHSMAETTIRFIEALSEPVIPFSLYQQALDASSSYSQCKMLVSYLPTVNYNVFYYLVSFLREVLAYPENRLTPDKLAVVFSSVLLRPTQAESIATSEAVIKKKADFVYHFLIDEDDLKVG